MQDVGISPDGAEALLASIRAEGGQREPTVEDLVSLEPKSIPRSSSQNYVDAYLEHRDRLCRSFSKSQLQNFSEALKLSGKGGRKKTDFADLIMEKHWGWESLGDVEKERRDRSEVSKKSEFDQLCLNKQALTACQLFLFLRANFSYSSAKVIINNIL